MNTAKSARKKVINPELDLQLADICDKFNLPGEYLSYDLIVCGNINSTYAVKRIEADGSIKKYTVQKVNMYVFKYPERIMENIFLVTNHIENKLQASELCEYRQAMHFFSTSDGRNFYRDGSAGFWRISRYIEGSATFNESVNNKLLHSAGKAFGEFQTFLSDFDAERLNETIPDFHNTRKRIADLFVHAGENPVGRVKYVTDELKYIRSVSEISSKLTEMLDNHEIPLRVTHNDTKINNVLFDEETLEPVAVIDLDTVMPGLAMHDFGDAVRFAANAAAEDEADLSKVSLDLDLFRNFTDGFIGEIAHSLTKNEIDTMALGAFTITVELAVRFLDDYILGDKYFKINYKEHNLVRARCQIALAKDMMSKMDDMNAIVEKVYREHSGE